MFQEKHLKEFLNKSLQEYLVKISEIVNGSFEESFREHFAGCLKKLFGLLYNN